MTTEPEQALLNRTWRPTLSVTGAEGLPPLSSAGNVLRPRTAFAVAAPAAAGRRRGRLAGDQGAAGSRRAVQRQGHLQGQRGAATGWNAPASAPWLTQALDAASQAYYGSPCGYIGQGGTIPLMSILQRASPRRSSWSAACWARSPTPTAPTSSCTFPTARSSPPPWPNHGRDAGRLIRRPPGLAAGHARPVGPRFFRNSIHDHHLRRLRQRAGRNPALAQPGRHRPEPLSFAKAVQVRTRSATPSATPPTPRAC